MARENASNLGLADGGSEDGESARGASDGGTICVRVTLTQSAHFSVLIDLPNMLSSGKLNWADALECAVMPSPRYKNICEYLAQNPE